MKLEFRYFQRWECFIQNTVSKQLKVTVKGCPRMRYPQDIPTAPLESWGWEDKTCSDLRFELVATRAASQL